MDGKDSLPDISLFDGAEAEAFVEQVRQSGFDYLRFEFADTAGLSRGKTVPIDHIAGYMRKGLNF